MLYYELNYDDVKDMQDGSMSKRVNLAIAAGVSEGLLMLERRHKIKHFIRGNAASSKTHPSKITWRTGGLAKSFDRYHKKGDHFGWYGSPLKRAALLEYGGTVKAAPGKALAIPTDAARVGVGGSISPRNFPPGELFRPKGKSFLAKNVNGKLVVMFNLVRSVTIPKRPILEKATKEIENPFFAMMEKKIAKAMDKK